MRTTSEPESSTIQLAPGYGPPSLAGLTEGFFVVEVLFPLPQDADPARIVAETATATTPPGP